MTKIFIYNDEWVSKPSRDDAKALFESGDICQQADVVLSDFQFNPAQLQAEKPVFIVPGGSACFMSDKMVPAFNQIKHALNGHYNYIGFCAGAYLAADTMSILDMDKTGVDTTLTYAVDNCPTPCMPIKTISLAATSSIGPFHPNYSDNVQGHSNDKKRYQYYPQVTPIYLSNGTSMNSLYVEGCTFANVPDKYSAAAFYRGSFSYTYNAKSGVRKVPMDSAMCTELPAILQKKADPETKTGGVLLSGTHIEATVKESAFLAKLGLFGGMNQPLRDDVIDKLRREQENSNEYVTDLIKETLQLNR